MQCYVRMSTVWHINNPWLTPVHNNTMHYCDVIMGATASQITSLTIVYSTIHSDADQRKHQSSASLAFVRGIHRWPVISPHKWPVTRKIWWRHHGIGRVHAFIVWYGLSPVGHWWEYYPGVPSIWSSHCNSLEDRVPVMKSTSTRSSNELYRPDKDKRVPGYMSVQKGY